MWAICFFRDLALVCQLLMNARVQGLWWVIWTLVILRGAHSLWHTVNMIHLQWKLCPYCALGEQPFKNLREILRSPPTQHTHKHKANLNGAVCLHAVFMSGLIWWKQTGAITVDWSTSNCDTLRYRQCKRLLKFGDIHYIWHVGRYVDT